MVTGTHQNLDLGVDRGRSNNFHWFLFFRFPECHMRFQVTFPFLVCSLAWFPMGFRGVSWVPS